LNINFPKYYERFIARTIDFALFVIICMLFLNIVNTYFTLDQDWIDGISISFTLLLYYGRWVWYYPFFELRGGTLGKRIMGLRTLDINTFHFPKQNQIKIKTRMIIKYVNLAYCFLLVSLIFYSITLLTQNVVITQGSVTLQASCIFYAVYCIYKSLYVADTHNDKMQGQHEQVSGIIVLNKKYYIK
jgi:hypothetical protein